LSHKHISVRNRARTDSIGKERAGPYLPFPASWMNSSPQATTRQFPTVLAYRNETYSASMS
jgi:hypothetical protein